MSICVVTVVNLIGCTHVALSRPDSWHRLYALRMVLHPPPKPSPPGCPPQFYIEEGRGNVDYLGYVLPKSRSAADTADNEDRLISVQFAWKGEEKNVSSFFVGE